MSVAIADDLNQRGRVHGVRRSRRGMHSVQHEEFGAAAGLSSLTAEAGRAGGNPDQRVGVCRSRWSRAMTTSNETLGLSPAKSLGILLLLAAASVAQETPTNHEGNDAHQGPSAFEAEFAASDIFRSGSYVQPLWRRSAFEGHYFGGHATDVGHTGVAWTFRLGELKLSPGTGVMFGSSGFVSTPAVSFRWEYEKRWFVTQGLVLQGFRKSPVLEEEGSSREPSHEGHEEVRPAIADGSHVSARWRRLTIGGTWERIHFRENEWKGGGRLAIRLFPRVSAMLYVLGPGKAEWRGGLLLHPSQE